MHTVMLVLVEIVVVITISRLVGLGFKSIKQPLVIGEIIAGIILGPSLFGLVSPQAASTLFPQETLPYLNILSQIGLIFFMFLIGLELNPKYLRGNLKAAVLISNISIIVPFALASILSFLLYPLVSTTKVPFIAFTLFLGAAMSITAFPVLARIITENNLQKTRLGTLALTCAAVDDVTAWCLLAISIAVARHGSIDLQAVLTIIESIVYIAFMFTGGRWLMQQLAAHYQRTGKLNQFILAVIYITVVISALITELIGIHLIFGAFLLGAAMPKSANFVRELAEKTEDFILIFLLPIFFAYSGLKTEIGLLNRPHLWLLCLLILAVAIAGKYFGAYYAARITGINKKEASALGWLMNTRGLTELIVLNIGLELGVITPLLFTMLVIMALVTTFMTSPLLEWTYPKQQIRLDVVETDDLEIETEPTVEISEPTITPYRILLPVANPHTQKGLLKLAVAIAVNYQHPAIVNPLSLIEFEEDYAFENTPAEANRLISERHQQLDELISSLETQEIRSYIHPIIRTSSNVARETVEIAKIQQPDLILIGWHRPAFSNNRLGGRVGQILATAPVDVAVFIDKGGERLENLLVPYSANIHDDLALILALRLLINRDNCMLQVLQMVNNNMADELSYEVQGMIEQLPQNVSDRIQIETLPNTEHKSVVVAASEKADLTIVGTSRAWGIERQTLGRYTDELALECRSSLLITRRYSQITSHLSSLLPEVKSINT